jgi:CheY-like chemotaxis protein
VLFRSQATGDLPAGTYVSISVQDNGAGMDETTMARVFEPFFSTKPVGKGTGLGLSQVYGFVRQSGGTVSVDSAPGRGTTVSLLLPASRTGAAADQAAPDPPVRRTAPLNVLLVEDDADVAALAQVMLTELGHAVTLAEDPKAALALARKDPRFTLLLTDVVMPGGKTGVDLAREVTGLRPGLPVLLSSGYTGEALASAEDAPWPLLRKPYTLDALARAIDNAVENTEPQFVSTGD